MAAGRHRATTARFARTAHTASNEGPARQFNHGSIRAVAARTPGRVQFPFSVGVEDSDQPR